MRRLVIFFALCLITCAWAASAFAQGVQTGTIRGVVRDAQGLAVPGVTVTATSPALQGPRVAVTDTVMRDDRAAERVARVAVDLATGAR